LTEYGTRVLSHPRPISLRMRKHPGCTVFGLGKHFKPRQLSHFCGWGSEQL